MDALELCKTPEGRYQLITLVATSCESLQELMGSRNIISMQISFGWQREEYNQKNTEDGD